MADHVAPAGAGVKVQFRLDPDNEGWPPAPVECLWAVQVEADTVRLDNTPWFVRNVACGDVFRVRTDADGQRWAEECLEWSGHCTIRVLPWPDGPLHGSRQLVLDAFWPVGVTGEGIEHYGIVALDIPPDADIAQVRTLLINGVRDGWWDYEEGCVSDAWIAAEPA